MALFEDLFESNIATTAAVGIGTVMLAPTLLPIVGQVIKPVAKVAIKGGILAYVWSRERLAELGEAAEDVYAEAKAEMQHGPLVEGQPSTTEQGT